MKFRVQIKTFNPRTESRKTIDEVVQVPDSSMGVALSALYVKLRLYLFPIWLRGLETDVEFWLVQQATDLIAYN